jgi:hypothetical protein
MGDGGQCALPSPPIVVQGGAMHQELDGAAELMARTVPSQWFTMMRGTGVDAMRELVDQSSRDQPGMQPAVVVPCSCGHVFAARDRS